MKKLCLLFTIFLLCAGCSRVQPVLNINDQPIVTTGHKLSINDVKKAILAGAATHQWNTKVIKPGLIMASHSSGSHTANLEIKYTKSTYSINYVSSQNFKYANGKIHKRYNSWVKHLDDSIRNQLNILEEMAK